MESQKREITLEEFKTLFDTYYESIKNFLYFKTGEIGLAEDLAQDVFVKLWENKKEIKLESIKSYLYTIANNLAINQLKHRKIVFEFVARKPGKESVETPEYIIESKEFHEKLKHALAGIPDKSREVFLMNRIEGFTYQEIADRLELSVKAVEKRMHKALHIIREKIGQKI